MSGQILTLNVAAAQDEAALASAIESVLLVASEPVSIAGLIGATQRSRSSVERAIEILQSRLRHGIRLQRHGNQLQLVTAPENVEAVQRFLGGERPAPLTRAALETLTVVAYRQPVTRAEIEEARGVDSDHSIRKLLARGLIEERGHRQTIGQPVEFGTTLAFLEYFGLMSLDDLPPLPDTSGDGIDPGGLGLRG